MDFAFSACESLPWTMEWEVEVLIFNSVGYVSHTMEDVFQEDEWGEYGRVGDHLAPCILLGDNFAMNSKDGNSERVDFYILMCTKMAFTFKKPFKCPWGQEFNAGDMAVGGKYY